MIGLSDKQRALLADKLPDLANLVVGTLVFGQALSEHQFSIALSLLGFGLWSVLIYLAGILVERKKHHG